MKKLLLIPALVGTMAMATDYNYEVTPVVGYNVAEGNLNLKNEIITGLEMQFNDVDCDIKPELSLLHSGGVKSENTTPTNTTNVTRVGLNGVYEISDSDAFSTFAKAGAGYEHMNRDVANNTDGAFVDAGAGVKIPFTKALALKLEALYMLKYNDNSAGGNWGDSNLALLAGLNYSFGEKAQKPAPEPTPEPEPVDGDDDNDGVLNSVDKCPTTPAATAVNAEGCTIDGDDDNDGVLNSSDICLNTPAGEAVNVDGCPKVMILHAKFDNNSAVIQEVSIPLIKKYADFLKSFSAYSSEIIGHTSSTGSQSYNLSLSQKRAEAVKNMLIELGVSADRLTSSGQGEANPIADNSTKEGRLENRRIEASLIRN